MIVVIGSPVAMVDGVGSVRPAGRAAGVATAAARDGARAQLVGKVGDDPAGDALLIDLAAAGVGHVALLRDPAHATPNLTSPAEAETGSPLDDTAPSPAPLSGLPLEPADAELALRYLTEYGTVVVAEPQADAVIAVVVAASAYVGAALILVTATGEAPPSGLPDDTVVIEAPPGSDPDSTFAGFVGRLAAAVDRGAAPADAFRDLGATLGVLRVTEA